MSRRFPQWAGTLGALPMPIPKDTVCLLFSPSGSVTTTALFKSGSAPLKVDWSTFGPDSSFPLDSRLFGYVSASGAGTIQFCFLPRDIAQAVRFDTVSPISNSSLTQLNSILAALQGTLTVGNTEFSNLAGILSALQGTLAVDNSEFANLASILTALQGTLATEATVIGNSGGGSPVLESALLSTGTTAAATITFNAGPPSGKKWRLWGWYVGVKAPSAGPGWTLNNVRTLINTGDSFFGSGSGQAAYGWATASALGWVFNGTNQYGVVFFAPPSMNSAETNANFDDAVNIAEVLRDLPYPMTLQVEVNITGMGSDGAYIYVMPLGVQEPL